MNIKISIIGKSNVGKSTLFNKLTNEKSLISNIPGITRDRKYGKYKYNNNIFFIDTASIDNKNLLLNKNIYIQTNIAIIESDIIFFVVEINKIESIDYKILKKIKFYNNKEIILIVNKIDIKKNIIDFIHLKIQKIYYISAKYNINIKKILKYLNNLKFLHKQKNIFNNTINKTKLNNVNILLLGKSNIGKSTLINKLINQNRLLVSNYPGTTVESIKITFKKNNLRFNIIDTSGFDKNINIGESNYKLNLNQIINKKIFSSNFIIFMMDFNISKNELSIINYIKNMGKIIIILINKIDLLTNKILNSYKEYLYKKLLFIKYIKIFYISALFDINNDFIIKYIYKIYNNLNKKFKTKLINDILNEAIKNFNPYNKLKFKPKLKYGYVICENPFKLIIHGNNIFNIKNSYKKYLENFFRKKLKIYDIPIIIIFKK